MWFSLFFDMVHYKLYYFPVRGKGEAIRQIFKLAGEEFEEQTVSMEEWPQLKPEMPLYQLPVLEVDGVKIGQSVAIMRFLGHQFHRAGSNVVDCARLDMIADVIQEMTNQTGMAGWGKVLLGMDGTCTDKTAYFKEHVLPHLEKYAPLIEKFLVENGNNGLLIGDKETWTDIYCAEMFARLVDFGLADALDAYPHIKALITRIHNIPAIKQHIETRKPTPV